MLTRIGNCNHCGKCCLPPIITESPMIKLGEDRCKFYRDDVGPEMYGHCLILGRGAKPIEAVRDRFGNKITLEQIQWFNDNCIDYPTAEDAKTGIYPPSECGFSFEVMV